MREREREREREGERGRERELATKTDILTFQAVRDFERERERHTYGVWRENTSSFQIEIFMPLLLHMLGCLIYLHRTTSHEWL